MSEYFFGVGCAKLAASFVKKIEEALKDTDVSLANPNLPGEGYRYWFAGPNRGDPWNTEMERDVFERLERAGIKLPNLR